MSVKRRRRSAEYKVALEAAKGDETLSQLAEQYYLHPGQISEWKRQAGRWGQCVSKQQSSEAARAGRPGNLAVRADRVPQELVLSGVEGGHSHLLCPSRGPTHGGHLTLG